MALPFKAAVTDKCKECIYDPIGGGGTWRQQVADCTAYKCPLFPVRPLPTEISKEQSVLLRDSELALGRVSGGIS